MPARGTHPDILAAVLVSGPYSLLDMRLSAGQCCHCLVLDMNNLERGSSSGLLTSFASSRHIIRKGRDIIIELFISITTNQCKGKQMMNKRMK